MNKIEAAKFTANPTWLTFFGRSDHDRLVHQVVTKHRRMAGTGLGYLRDGTWRLPGDKIAALPVGTYDVKVIAENSIGLVRKDPTINELTIVHKSKFRQ